MTQALRVVSAGIQTSVQDLGRFGYREVGVPPSGPLDRISFRVANHLVGNRPAAPALEFLYQGPRLEVLAESVRVALVGCSAHIEVRSAHARHIPPGRSARLVRGEVMRVGALGGSTCAYLAIEGGLDLAPVLGSASTYVRGAIGGHEGRLLRSGDLLPIRRSDVAIRRERALRQPFDLAFDETIRVLLGPQAELFTADAVHTLLSSEYKVSAQADRMGFRLDGPRLQHVGSYDIVSDGIVEGAIQVPGSGLPIVLMVDAPTTGGYPKIATVISADVPVLGRRMPGKTVRFTAVDMDEAESLRRGQEAWIEGCAREIP